MNTKSNIPKNNNLLENARRLRREMTRHEKHLWYDFLQKYPVKIYKQRIIGNYIVDFYCASAKLVIELDGSQHYEEEAMEYDIVREEFMAQFGLKTLRFSNLEIDRNFSGVCELIDNTIKERTTLSAASSTSPEGRGEALSAASSTSPERRGIGSPFGGAVSEAD